MRAEYAAKACGFSLAFEPSLDWQGAYGLRIQLAAHRKTHFSPLCAQQGTGALGTLPEDAQYNQMMLPAQDANQPVDIGFNEFVLADWWLASHPVASPYNLARFDHVTSPA